MLLSMLLYDMLFVCLLIMIYLFNYTIMETFIVALLILWCAIVIPAMVIETIVWVYEVYKDLFK